MFMGEEFDESWIPDEDYKKIVVNELFGMRRELTEISEKMDRVTTRFNQLIRRMKRDAKKKTEETA